MFLEFENYFKKYSNKTLTSLVVFTSYVAINSLEKESFHNVFPQIKSEHQFSSIWKR